MAIPADVGAALSALMYDLSDAAYPNASLTLQEILDSNIKLKHRAELENIIEQYDLGSVVLVDASWQRKTSSGEKIYGSMNACTFKFYPDGETYIAYRGTGDSNWKYNADSAFGDEPSQMQEWAKAYCDQTLNDYYVPGGELYLTGHSQGGNNAMYALLTSKYADYVTGCVSVDGPGFSQDVIDDIIKKYGREFFEEQVRKCTGIYGENDYVHCLGEVHIIPEDQTFTVATPTASGFDQYHDIFSHYTSGKLNYEVDENGNIISIEPGPITVIADLINKGLLDHLPEEDRHVCAQAAMALVEYLIGDKKISNLSDLSDFVTLCTEGVPMLIRTMIENPDSFQAVLEKFAPDLAKFIEKHPAITAAIVSVVTVIAVRYILPKVGMLLAALSLIDFVAETVENLIKFGKKAYTALKNFISDVKKAITKVKEYVKSLTPGNRYARNNPEFRADTALMRDYANRLRSINSRLVTLDRDMNDLYWQVGLMDVYDILRANIISGYSPRITMCRTYLNSAADALEKADRKVLSYMGG